MDYSKIFKKLTTSVLFLSFLSVQILAFPITNVHAASSSDGYNYSVSDGNAVITGYTGAGGNISIPGSIDGYPVTAIGPQAFDGCTTLTGVTLPTGVTKIGYCAFDKCTNLTSVNLPNGLITIEDYAFEYCLNLPSVTVPNSVTSLGKYVFYRCYALSSVILSTSITTLDSGVFELCTSLPAVNIPESVTAINGFAFASCSSLANVTMGNSITGLGMNAFYNCRALKSVTIPSSVTHVDDYAFSDCTSLKQAKFLGDPPAMGLRVFINNSPDFRVNYIYGNMLYSNPWQGYPAEPAYTVSYIGNGSTSGTVPADKSTYASGESVTVCGNTGNLSKAGCSFAGWNTASDGSGTTYTCSEPNNKFAMGSSGNVTLFAKWEALPDTKQNAAAGKTASSSVSFLNLSRITDGDKNTAAYSSTPYAGWVQLDLGSSFKVSEIKLWHYYGDTRKYRDVIVQLSNDPSFTTGVTTVFNNDADNSSGFGAGKDGEYTETTTGLSIPVSSLNARYARFYSNGSNVNTYNHYVEIEIYGTQASTMNLALNKASSSTVSFLNRSRITDGDRTAAAYASSPYAGWVQLDLGSSSDISNIKLLHYYGDKRKYHDVIIQLSNDPTFTTGVTTVFNNDADNSSGAGAGSDSEYTETSSGLDLSFSAVNARYARFYSNGNTVNSYNHYVEIEIY